MALLKGTELKKEIQRLTELGFSKRAISKLLQTHRNTVTRYLDDLHQIKSRKYVNLERLKVGEWTVLKWRVDERGDHMLIDQHPLIQAISHEQKKTGKQFVSVAIAKGLEVTRIK